MADDHEYRVYLVAFVYT